MEPIHALLTEIYGPELGALASAECQQLIENFRPRVDPNPFPLSEKDAMLITYGDQVQGGSPGRFIEELHDFYNVHLKEVINAVHFLPFFPYTSDDGFSVVDYLKIDPELGDWQQVKNFSKDANLMFDAVVNHISKSSDWFKGYCEGNPEYENFFIAEDPNTDLSMVTRPRALPLLHPFKTNRGEEHIWTTFSEDQVDINASNPKVMIKVLEALLIYAENGAKYIRLDAIAFLWKEIGTDCIHHPKTHAIVKLFRAVFEEVCPGLKIITETNVPHEENLSYFGSGRDEAHLVYNFTLPPLLAWSILNEDATRLRNWANSLQLPSEDVTFFNFTASHDGIGMRPLQGIMTPAEIEALAQHSLDRGGHVSYKDNGDGTKSPYELNCNYMDFLNPLNLDLDVKVQRFLCSQAVMLSMPGVPGIYVHSLLGSENHHDGVEETGRARSINREKFQRQNLEKEMAKPDSRRQKVFDGYRHLLSHRSEYDAFSPTSKTTYPDFGPKTFAILREGTDNSILCLFNLTSQEVNIEHGMKGRSLIQSGLRDNHSQLSPNSFDWILL